MRVSPLRRLARGLGRFGVVPFVPLLLTTARCATGASPRAANPGEDAAGCGHLDVPTCLRARGLLLAAEAFAAVAHPFVLDPREARPTGAGIDRTGAALAAPVCAHRESGSDLAPPASVGAPDVAFAGVSVGGALFSIDELAPDWLFTASPRPPLELVVFALVRPKNPDFMAAEPAVHSHTFYEKGDPEPRFACSCGTASGVVGALRDGASIGLEFHPPAEARGRFRDLLRAALEARGAASAPVSIAYGALAIDGLAALLDGGAARPLGFRVTEAVPLARALYPVADFCPGALPSPEVGPTPLDFGDAAYGTEAVRTVQITNRAPYPVDAIVGPRTLVVPARTRASLPLTWTPAGQALATELQTREETLLFVPHGASAAPPVRQETAHLPEVVRTGPPRLVRREALTATAASGAGARVDTTWSCPADFVVTRCEAASPRCADPGGRCASPGAQLLAEALPAGTGCHFRCGVTSLASGTGPACGFQAGMECRLQFSAR